MIFSIPLASIWENLKQWQLPEPLQTGLSGPLETARTFASSVRFSAVACQLLSPSDQRDEAGVSFAW